MKKFFADYILFKKPKSEKDIYRLKIMDNDHFVYRNVLVILMIFQLIMLVMSFINKGFIVDDPKHIAYRCLYGFLFITLLISFLTIGPTYKRKNPFAYFAIVSISMVAIMLWGAGISFIDSFKSFDLTMYAVATIGACFFLVLEPKFIIINVLSTGALFIVLVCINPGGVIQNGPSAGFFINAISIILVGLVGAIFNFFRRIYSLTLEQRINNLNATLEEKAYIDDLTQVHNRRYLTEHINTVLETGEYPSGVMLFDIDHFKNINDQYGHLNGDICLKYLGDMIREFLLEKDAYCVRYGGEEFLIFFPHVTKDILFEIASEFKNKVKSTDIILKEGNKIHFKISIGLAIAEDNMSYASLINKADMALYKAKENRDTVTFEISQQIH